MKIEPALMRDTLGRAWISLALSALPWLAGCQQTEEPTSAIDAATTIASIFDGTSGEWVDLTQLPLARHPLL
jgi:hypothetical protein